MTLKGILILLAAIGLAALAVYWLRTLPSKAKPGERPNDDGR